MTNGGGNATDDRFAALREHEATMQEIAASADPDAHIARILRQLMHGEKPDATDVSRVTRARPSDDGLESALDSPPDHETLLNLSSATGGALIPWMHLQVVDAEESS